MSQNKILLESGTNELEIVEFYLDEAGTPNFDVPDGIEQTEGYRGHYGINVAKVVEIIRCQTITALPQMRHPSILGAFPYRDGRIVPLIDLGIFLEKGPIPPVDAKIIITEFNRVETAFLVSGVTRIHRISWTQVEAPGKFLQDMSHQSITGVVRLQERVIFLLDLEAIVAVLHPALAIRMNPPEEVTVAPPKIYRILHADDSGSVRKLVLRMLENEGRFEVVQVSDGQEAWDQLQALKQEAENSHMPIQTFLQGIITDIEMPNMDGMALCKRIKDDPILRKLPVAVFSSLITPAVELKCATVGADAQFAKPDLQGISDKMYELIASRGYA